LVEEVLFLVYVMNKNGLVVNTLEQENTVAPVLKRPRKKIIGYVACTYTLQLGGDAPLYITGM
jgi:hypothetical protein